MSVAVYHSAGRVLRIDWSAHTPAAQARGALINPVIPDAPLWQLRVVGDAIELDPLATPPVRPKTDLEQAIEDALATRHKLGSESTHAERDAALDALEAARRV